MCDSLGKIETQNLCLDRNNNKNQLPGLEVFRVQQSTSCEMLVQLFYRILDSCTGHDANKSQAIRDMNFCVDSPYKYYDSHVKNYKKYGVEHPDSLFPIYFYGMMDILLKYKYVGVFRDNVKVSDVPDILSNINKSRDAMLILHGNMFDSSLSLYDMLTTIHKRCVKRYDCRVVCIRSDNWCFLFLE